MNSFKNFSVLHCEEVNEVAEWLDKAKLEISFLGKKVVSNKGESIALDELANKLKDIANHCYYWTVYHRHSENFLDYIGTRCAWISLSYQIENLYKLDISDQYNIFQMALSKAQKAWQEVHDFHRYRLCLQSYSPLQINKLEKYNKFYSIDEPIEPFSHPLYPHFPEFPPAGPYLLDQQTLNRLIRAAAIYNPNLQDIYSTWTKVVSQARKKLGQKPFESTSLDKSAMKPYMETQLTPSARKALFELSATKQKNT